MAPALGRRAVRHRYRRRVRSRGVPPRGRGRRVELGDRMIPLRDLPAMEVGARADRVRARLADAGVDALLVTRLPNVRYLTGFAGSAGLVLLGPDAMVLVTDGRYAEQSRAQVGAAGVRADVAIGSTHDEQRAALVGAA